MAKCRGFSAKPPSRRSSMRSLRRRHTGQARLLPSLPVPQPAGRDRALLAGKLAGRHGRPAVRNSRTALRLHQPGCLAPAPQHEKPVARHQSNARRTTACSCMAAMDASVVYGSLARPAGIASRNFEPRHLLRFISRTRATQERTATWRQWALAGFVLHRSGGGNNPRLAARWVVAPDGSSIWSLMAYTEFRSNEKPAGPVGRPRQTGSPEFA